jgi:hypothetical protein
MHYSWMSQQTWQDWHSSWYMSITFIGGQLRKIYSSENSWKPGQQERIFFNSFVTHQMDFGGQDVLVSELMAQTP